MLENSYAVTKNFNDINKILKNHDDTGRAGRPVYQTTEKIPVSLKPLADPVMILGKNCEEPPGVELFAPLKWFMDLLVPTPSAVCTSGILDLSMFPSSPSGGSLNTNPPPPFRRVSSAVSIPSVGQQLETEKGLSSPPPSLLCSYKPLFPAPAVSGYPASAGPNIMDEVMYVPYLDGK
ncbi:uncharacterized protein MELLADRAFT_104713 [Melampsora larici-populina 98AG31]|uniref:Uncharacterized protein n=1 Tax=Melampsora larici-populina (strain 98AG31 / pathotype 3-4-7) TaxID=747676 RepID=F4RFN2_MELLP|nr:uncharacterized protein MELLADRAFT_104713 [Melampsora larici-populina 98AG31]EGG08902.1 hypothetical protein MELLADRAFT_104713 [Melampsora larici-populina 98AG31]